VFPRGHDFADGIAAMRRTGLGLTGPLRWILSEDREWLRLPACRTAPSDWPRMQGRTTRGPRASPGQRPGANRGGGRPPPRSFATKGGPIIPAIGYHAGTMRGAIWVTDYDWYEFLIRQPGLDEVNFWRPSDRRTPRQLVPGVPVIFKLRKARGGRIVGFGIFAKHRVLPAWLAWDAFGAANGAPGFTEMRNRVERLRHDRGGPQRATGDYEIGCVMLTQPVFFPREDWVSAPAGWPENAVQGRGYDLSEGEGARIWRECLERAARIATPEIRRTLIAENAPRYGEPSLVAPRLGQGTFRIAVLDAYGRSCAVTGEHSLPALEAAHIRPFSSDGPRAVSNGLLLRSDIHRLFDRGYVGVTTENAFVVSRHLREDFSNGRSYYPLHGRSIQMPEAESERPDGRPLEWHLENVFRG
jgi:putative restriction endonuclease